MAINDNKREAMSRFLNREGSINDLENQFWRDFTGTGGSGSLVVATRSDNNNLAVFTDFTALEAYTATIDGTADAEAISVATASSATQAFIVGTLDGSNQLTGFTAAYIRVNGAWVSVAANLAGTAGPAGADGADGTDGTDGADGTDGVDGTALEFTSVAERDAFFVRRPDLLRLNVPVNVFMGGDTVTIQIWKGGDAPTSYDPSTQSVFWIAASVRTGTSSLELGEIHTVSSGGENVFFTNSVSDVSYFPPWQSVGNHSTVEGQVVQNIPTHRVYGDLEFVEVRGPAQATGAVEHNSVTTLTRNEAVFGLRFLPAENYTGQYEYRVTDVATGTVAFSQVRSGTVVSGQELIFWFEAPVEGFEGQEVRTQILKEDGTFGLSRPSTDNPSEPYIQIRTRGFTDTPIASSTDVDRLQEGIDILANSSFNSGRGFVRFNTSFTIDGTNLATYNDRNILYTAAIDKVTDVHLPSNQDISDSGLPYPIVMEFTHLGGTARIPGSNVVRVVRSGGNPSLIVDNVTFLQMGEVSVISKESAADDWTATNSVLDPSSTLLPSGVFQLQTNLIIDNIANIETELAGETIVAGDAYFVAIGGNRFGSSIGDSSVIVAVVNSPSLLTNSDGWLVIENGSGSITNDQALFLNQIARNGNRFDLSSNVFTAPENVTVQTNTATGTPASGQVFTPNSGTEEIANLGTIPIQFSGLVGGNLRLEYDLITQASSGFLPEFRDLVLTFGDVSFTYNLRDRTTDTFNIVDTTIPNVDYSNAVNIDMTATLSYIERGAQWLGRFQFNSMVNTLTGTLHDPVVALIDAGVAPVRADLEAGIGANDRRLDGVDSAIATILGQISHPVLTLPDAVVGILTNDVEVQQEDNVTRVPSMYNLQLGGGTEAGALGESGSPASDSGQTDSAAINAAPVARRGRKLAYPIISGIADGGTLLQSGTSVPLITREGDSLVVKRFVPAEAGGSTNVTHYPLPANQVRHDWFTITAKTASLQPVSNELLFVNDMPTSSTTLTIFSRGLANGNPFGAQTITLAGVGGGSDVSTSYTETVGGETLNVTVTYRASRGDVVVQVDPVLTSQLALADLQVRLEWAEVVTIPSSPATSEDVVLLPYSESVMIPVVVKPSITRVDSNAATLVVVTSDREIDTGYAYNTLFGTTDTGRLEFLVEGVPLYDINFDASSVTVAGLETRVSTPLFGLFTDNHSESTVVDLDTQMSVRNAAGDVIRVGQELVLTSPDSTRWSLSVKDDGGLEAIKL